MAKEFTDENFQDEVLNSKIPVVMDFWAEWCGPCRVVGPIIDELSNEYDGQVSIGKMNVDENQDIPGKFSIRSIPTLIFFKDGKEVGKIVGASTKNVIEEKIKNLL